MTYASPSAISKNEAFIRRLRCRCHFFTFSIVISAVYLRQSVIETSRKKGETLLTRIVQDFTVHDTAWDTSKYLADTQTPNPYGSSGFTMPLYIFTTGGFVVERNAPISGFLDASDFSKAMSFRLPQYVTGETSERWRFVSVPLNSNAEAVGVVMVSYYNPPEEGIAVVDQNLLANAEMIRQKIEVASDGTIDTSRLDIRNIHYTVSFEVITKHNKVVAGNGRTPSFIDVSYVDTALRFDGRVVVDQRTQTPYSVVVAPIRNTAGKISGVALSGYPLSDLSWVYEGYLRAALLWSVLLYLPVCGILTILLWQWRVSLSGQTHDATMLPKRLSFIKTTGVIRYDNTVVSIPFSSNQWYLCDAVFSKPEKYWEADELLDRIGSAQQRGLLGRCTMPLCWSTNGFLGR